MERLGKDFQDLLGRLRTDTAQWLEGLQAAEILAALVLLCLVVAFRRTLARWGTRIIVRTAKTIGVTIGETVEEAIRPAAQTLLISLALLILVEALNFPDAVAGTLERVLASVAIAAIFAAMYSLTDSLAELLARYRTPQTAMQVDWFVRIMKVICAGVGVAAVLKVWGHRYRSDPHRNGNYRRRCRACRAGPFQKPDCRHHQHDRKALPRR